MPVELEMALRLVLAVVLGAVVGFQRERSGKEAGLRTNILICLGAALFTLISVYGFTGSDPARVAAGIVTGIGFIGAGIILHRTGGYIAGLTTAATTWAVAGIGVAAGVGLYIISAVATVLVVLVLLIPHLQRPTE